MIFEKLQKARIELQNKKLKKSGKNGYSGFTYYELADFLPQVNQIFYDLKLCSNFSIEDRQAKLTVTDWEDNTKEVFTSPIEDLELKGCSKVQALGGVHTYLKRYLYLNALEIVESDMLDAKAGKIEEVKEEPFISDVIKNSTPSQPSPLGAEELDDTDIYLGLSETIDSKSALKYFNDYKDKVNDKAAFTQAWKDHIKTFGGK
jgi:hypothetical protein